MRLKPDFLPPRNVFMLFFSLFLIAVTVAFLLPSIGLAAPTSTSITSSHKSDQIDPGSLNIHGLRCGMSRTQIESIIGPPLRTGGSTWYGIAKSKTPKNPMICVDYSAQQTAVAIQGYDLQTSDTVLLGDGISLEEIKAKLGEPSSETQEEIGAPTVWRYEDLKLTIAWWDMRGHPTRKIFAIILEAKNGFAHP